MLIGRDAQKQEFKDALLSKRSELMVVYGRRRVGKTFLIREVLKKDIDFYMTGIHEATLEDQLENFADKLASYGYDGLRLQSPTSWKQAFDQLKTYLSSSRKRKKKVIFLDELPWMATARSKFLSMLGHFWNDWAESNNVLLVLCGSAASWMVNNVINNKGGLHNRVTRYMKLDPFSLNETERFLKAKNIQANRYQIVQLYMVLGGIPFYLELLRADQSIPQNIDRLCFDTNGPLKEEFDRIYTSLFFNADSHIAIIRALSTKWKGMTRNEIADHSGLANGGSLTRTLNELEKSAFIMTWSPLQRKKKGTLYRLTDNFSLFYLKIMSNPKLDNQKGAYLKLFTQPTYRSWTGYAFENICMLHQPQISQGIGIQAIAHKYSSFQFSGNDDYPGMQVDLVIDRADGIVNLCEMKYANANFVLTNDYKQKLQQRAANFIMVTESKKAVMTTLVTTYGMDNKELHLDAIQQILTFDTLFAAAN